MTYKDSQLAVATQHVAAGKRIVARQLDLIARMKAAGHPTSEHERTLRLFMDTLTIFEDHERELRLPRPLLRAGQKRIAHVRGREQEPPPPAAASISARSRKLWARVFQIARSSGNGAVAALARQDSRCRRWGLSLFMTRT